MHSNTFSKNPHLLGCDLSNEKTKEVLNEITKLGSLGLPLVCLPDLHLKERTEGPSSFAAATVDTIVPELTAPSVGCGMGVLTTTLTTKDMSHNFFEKFYDGMRSNLGPRYGHFKNLLLWLGLISRPASEYDISIAEFEDIIKRGAQAAIEKYDLNREFIDHIEYKGSHFSREEQTKLNLNDILPHVSYRSGRHDLGYGFKGNHFLEIQYVEEILDAEIARKWGINLNQVVIMYHGGGGAVSYHVGRYFGNRKKNTFKQKLVLSVLKVLFHFGSPTAWKYAKERFKYYFFPKSFMEIPTSTDEGVRLFAATKASLNYSYGFRMAMIKRISDSLTAALPSRKPEAFLLWDSNHNSIVPEEIDGKNYVVHRHTANRVFEGSPVIISGFNTTSSYLAVGQPNAEKYLFSADHGAGVTIKKMERDGMTKAHPKNLTTHIYQTKSPFKKIVEHITDEGIDYVVKKLEEENIARPIVKLRPLAVFKG
jgi:tRNA-splicing ligase RtcB (3'-phosphate/5'-hydroxy nucleic acid ligase)